MKMRSLVVLAMAWAAAITGCGGGSRTSAPGDEQLGSENKSLGEEPHAPAADPNSSSNATCPDPNSSQVHFLSTDFKECAAMFFQCEPNQTTFNDECGCGCIDP
ncbi:MAG: hypothetical protein ACT4TC_04630 [Myxococcaceae bacterium]